MYDQIRIKVTNLLARNRTYTLSDGSSIRLQSGDSKLILAEQLSEEIKKASEKQQVLLHEVCVEEKPKKSRKRSE